MNFYTEVIAKDPRFHSTEPVHDLALLEPVTRAAVLAVIADAEADGIHLMAWETYRSKERQLMLYEQKATKLKNVGVHHYGLAGDFVRLVKGKPSWEGDFSIILRLAMKHKLICGADWGQPKAKHTFIDPGHVQRCSLARQNALFGGKWYPAADYDPYLD